MINIEITQQQAEELKTFYVAELEKLQKRADVIRELLNKLDAGQTHIKLPETTEVKEKLPKKVTSPVEADAKNPSWGNYIIQILQEKQKPLTSKEFLKLYKKQYKINIANPKNAKTSLAQALFGLRTKTKQIQSIKTKGKKEKLYGLSEWADTSVLITNSEQKEKIKKNKPETTIAIEHDEKVTPKFAYNWPQFIRETLNKQKRILSLSEFVKYAMKHFELSADKTKFTRSNLAPTVSTLGKSKILKSIQKEGINGKSYGLAEWFEEDGNLIPEYK